MTFETFLICGLVAIVFFLIGYRWGMRDKVADENSHLQIVAKQRDYWQGIATRNKNELIRLQSAGLIPGTGLFTEEKKP